MAKGYVSIHRELFDHWVWEEKPFSRGQAWIDLILMANHTDAKIMFDGRFIEVSRGDIITSSVKLADRWGWSRTKVGLFLENLESDKMIVKKTDSKKTALTICKYSDWQDTQTTKEQQKDSRKTAERQQKDTINNVNKENNVNNKDLKELVTDYTENTILQDSINDFIEHRKAIKKPLSSKGLELTFKNLDKLTGSDKEKSDILNQSIANGWQGVFAIKQDFAKSSYTKETNVERARKLLFGGDEEYESSRNKEIVILDDEDMAKFQP